MVNIDFLGWINALIPSILTSIVALIAEYWTPYFINRKRDRERKHIQHEVDKNFLANLSQSWNEWDESHKPRPQDIIVYYRQPRGESHLYLSVFVGNHGYFGVYCTMEGMISEKWEIHLIDVFPEMSLFSYTVLFLFLLFWILVFVLSFAIVLAEGSFRQMYNNAGLNFFRDGSIVIYLLTLQFLLLTPSLVFILMRMLGRFTVRLYNYQNAFILGFIFWIYIILFLGLYPFEIQKWLDTIFSWRTHIQQLLLNYKSIAPNDVILATDAFLLFFASLLVIILTLLWIRRYEGGLLLLFSALTIIAFYEYVWAFFLWLILQGRNFVTYAGDIIIPFLWSIRYYLIVAPIIIYLIHFIHKQIREYRANKHSRE